MDYSHDANVKRRRRHRSSLPRLRNKIGVTVFRVAAAAALIGAFAAAGMALGLYRGILSSAPVIDVTTIMPGNYTSIIYSADTGAELQRLSGAENRVSVPFDRIPDNLKNAFIAIEDERFYSHNGVDIEGMGRALYYAVATGGARTEGASTITQQLIKNKLGKTENDLISKLQEQYMAVNFEKELAKPENLGSKKAAKDYILGVYMNMINLGRGYYGVQTAAWNYYGKDVADLTLAECATIAAITQNPSRYPPDIRPDQNRLRQELVLGNMRDLGFITEEEFQQAWNEDVYNHIVKGVIGSANDYYTDTLIEQISQDLQEEYMLNEIEASDWIYSKGLQIFSVQDLEIQQIADNVFDDPANFPEGDYEIDVEYLLTTEDSAHKTTNYNRKETVKTMEEVDAFVQSVKEEVIAPSDSVLAEQTLITEQPQASFVVIDYHNGHVKALIGGRGEKQVLRSFNRATTALRSPGSQFKTLASYAPALDLGRITAATVYDDAPYFYEGVEPLRRVNNWYGKNSYDGLSNVRRGIIRSMNILSVKNLMSVGIETSFSYLQNFGFTTLEEGEWNNDLWVTDLVPSLGLGGLTYGVKQYELCAAYGTIANMGEYHEPIFYTHVLDHEGNVLLENNTAPTQVIKPTTAFLLTDMMEDTLTSSIGTASRARFAEVSMPIAGKTGTTTDSKDLGFSGYTPYYAATVWMGFDQQKIIRDSNSYHLQIWRKIMEEIHRGLPERQFERPDGITTAVVCQDSGMLATDLCRNDPRGSRAYTEFFVSGTQPADECDVHQETTVCAVSGMRPSLYCPATDVETRVGIVRHEPVNYDINPAASVKDAQYEITPEMREGPECTTHSINTNPNYPFTDDPTQDWWNNNTPTPVQPLFPTPTPTPTPLGDVAWPWAATPPEG